MAYSENDLARLWVDAGGPPKVASLMAKIAKRESGGKAHINNAGLNKNGSVDYGLWQINSVHGYDPQKLYDPRFNAKAAVSIYKSQGLKAWSTYKPGVDDKFIGQAAQRASAARVGSYGGAAPAATSGGPNAKQQIALSLLGLGGLGSSYGGADPLTLALTQAAQQKAAPPARPVTNRAAGGPQVAPSGGSIGHFDGKPVVSWMVPILRQARSTGLWKGSVSSGIRTKQEQLSAAKRYGLQHYPHGPLASNHVQGHNGAVDVSDPEGLKRALKKLGITKLKSSMPEDAVHFSATGY